MTGWLLDTEVVSTLINPTGETQVKSWAGAQPEHQMFLSTLTLAEFERRIRRLEPDHPDRSRFATNRDALVGRFMDRILEVDDSVLYRWGVTTGDIERASGYSPPMFDMLMVATAIEHDLILVTRNVEHIRHTGVAIFNPWEVDSSRTPTN